MLTHAVYKVQYIQCTHAPVLCIVCLLIAEYIHTLMHTSAHTQHLLAVDDNGVVPSPPLYFGHFLDHISDGLEVGAPSIRCPVGDMELSHLVSFLRLHKKNILIWIQVHMDCLYISF